MKKNWWFGNVNVSYIIFFEKNQANSLTNPPLTNPPLRFWISIFKKFPKICLVSWAFIRLTGSKYLHQFPRIRTPIVCLKFNHPFKYENFLICTRKNLFYVLLNKKKREVCFDLKARRRRRFFGAFLGNFSKWITKTPPLLFPIFCRRGGGFS